MKHLAGVVSIGVMALLGGCKSVGTAEEFTWSADLPKDVDRGAEFTLLVKTVNPAGAAVNGVSYRYQILWPQGSANPLRHKGVSGDPEKVKARMVTGTATIVFTCPNREGLDVKVLESKFEVK
jgi:hypothetical protein